jgi:hypothetical protein
MQRHALRLRYVCTLCPVARMATWTCVCGIVNTCSSFFSTAIHVDPCLECNSQRKKKKKRCSRFSERTKCLFILFSFFLIQLPLAAATDHHLHNEHLIRHGGMFKYSGTKTKCQHTLYDASGSLINTLMTWHYTSIYNVFIHIYIIKRKKVFCVSIRLKKTYLLKLDLTLFQIYDASESQFKLNSTTTTHISLCPHLKKNY